MNRPELFKEKRSLNLISMIRLLSIILLLYFFKDKDLGATKEDRIFETLITEIAQRNAQEDAAVFARNREMTAFADKGVITDSVAEQRKFDLTFAEATELAAYFDKLANLVSTPNFPMDEASLEIMAQKYLPILINIGATDETQMKWPKIIKFTNWSQSNPDLHTRAVAVSSCGRQNLEFNQRLNTDWKSSMRSWWILGTFLHENTHYLQIFCPFNLTVTYQQELAAQVVMLEGLGAWVIEGDYDLALPSLVIELQTMSAATAQYLAVPEAERRADLEMNYYAPWVMIISYLAEPKPIEGLALPPFITNNEVRARLFYLNNLYLLLREGKLEILMQG